MNSGKLQNTRLIYKNLLFFYTLLSEKIRKQSHFQSYQKKKNLRINLSREVKDLYSENFKILMNETEDDTKWKANPCSWFERINIVKMSILLKAI